MEKNLNTSANESFKSATTGVRSTASDAKSAIMEKAGPAMDYLKENLSTVRDTTQPYIQDAEAMIKRHPFYALLGAVAVGAVFGAIVARPSSVSRTV